MALRLGVVSEFWAPAERAGGARSTARALAAIGDVEAFVVAGDRDVGDTEHMLTETLIRGMYRYWREVMEAPE